MPYTGKLHWRGREEYASKGKVVASHYTSSACLHVSLLALMLARLFIQLEAKTEAKEGARRSWIKDKECLVHFRSTSAFLLCHFPGSAMPLPTINR